MIAELTRRYGPRWRILPPFPGHGPNAPVIVREHPGDERVVGVISNSSGEFQEWDAQPAYLGEECPR